MCAVGIILAIICCISAQLAVMLDLTVGIVTWAMACAPLPGHEGLEGTCKGERGRVRRSLGGDLQLASHQ